MRRSCGTWEKKHGEKKAQEGPSHSAIPLKEGGARGRLESAVREQRTGQEETTSSCAIADLGWILGKTSSLKGSPALAQAGHHLWRHLKAMWMWNLRTWLSGGLGCAGEGWTQ